MNANTSQFTYGGKFTDAVIAVSELACLPCWGFIIFRGSVVVKTPTGYKKENGAGWSRPMKYASRALWWRSCIKGS